MFSVLMSEGRKKRDYKIGSENNKSAYKTSFWEESAFMKKMLRTRVIAVMICTGLTLSAAVSGSEQESDLEAVYDSIEAVGDESGEIYQE